MDATSIVVPSTTPGHMAPVSYTNGRSSPAPMNAAAPAAPSPPSGSDLSDTNEPIVHGASTDEDAPGEEYDEDVPMADETDSSSDVDAEGEPDGDYDSESPPPEQAAHSRARSSTSQESRGTKRKASNDDDYLRDPQLYGLRRSERPRPTRRIVDSSDDDEDSASDAPRKRRRTTSRKASNRPTPVYKSASSASDSDGYVGARKNVPSKKEKLRRRLAAQQPRSQDEDRYVSRRSRKVNYNEDEADQDSFMEEEDDMTPNYWTTTAEDTGPVIDKILDHRPQSDIELDPHYAEKKEFEYLIKWQDKAHYHSTWEPYDNIASCKGYRKIDNYFKNIILLDMERIARKTIEPEEYEQHMVAREQQREALLNYHVVERVINSRDGEDGTEYFVKWKGLTYDLCTWETDTLVSELAQNEIDRYLDRSTNRPVSDPKESNPNTRRPWEKIQAQPDYIKFGQLRSFQLQGLNFLAHKWCKSQNVILADEMGLGKTVQTVSFMNWLRHDRRQQGPFLCVVPLSTMPAWADTFNNWTPDVNYVIYTGREDARKVIRECELLVDGNVKKTKFNVLMTTYEFVLADASFLSQIKWQFLAVDEAHRLKNRDSQLYDRLLQFSAPSRLLITGTPIQNTLGELSALMDFLMPNNKIVADEHVDLEGEDASHKLDALSKAIEPYMIRRTKEKVENDLPPKTEKILRVELSETQLEYYKNILTRNYEALNEGGTGQKQSLLNIVMELKKASNHALLFANAEAKFIKANATKEETLKALITTSGKMMLLDRLLTKLKADGHRVLIFSQMVHMLDILTDYMRLRNYTYQRLDGTVPASDRKIAIDHFNAPGSDDYCFLLSTRAGGLGINLMTADTVVLFDSDWNPQADLQAMARAHRIGQQKPVTIYRLVSKDTIEEEILERARNKRMLEFITIQRGVTDRQQKEISDKLKANEPNSADDINNILKRRGQKMFEQSGNQKKLEDLDIDAVLENAEEHKTEQAAGLTSDGGAEFLKNFEYTDVKIDLEWDDIIPKEDLEVVKAEIQQRKDDEQTQKLLAESAPRKRKAAANSEREQRAAKKRAREATKRIDHDSDSDEDEDDSPKSDPKRALNTKETRNLVKAYERYGSLDERGPEMLKSARLTGRDMSVIKSTLDEIIAISDGHVKEEEARLRKLQNEANRPITKKDKKAVLFDYHNVKKLNAETIMDRPREMRVLQQAVNAVADFKQFRVPDALKPATYSCPWGAKEDGMLMVGIHRHGYGAWPAIRDDADLGLQDKFYLEEHRVDKKEERNKGDEKNAKSPGAVHLVRRANYLLTVLKDKIDNDPAVKRRMENHHRNNKKHQMKGAHRQSEKTSSAAASPGLAGQARKVASRESEKPSHRSHSNGDNRHSERPESRHHDKGTPDRRHRQSDQYRPSESRRKEHRADRDSIDRRPPLSDRKVSDDVQKSRSKDERSLAKDERPLPKEERPRPQEERPKLHSQVRGPSVERAASTPNEAEKKLDPFLERKLNNMQPNLKRLKKCTPKHYSKDQMIKRLKVELLAIGNFITHTARENSQTPDLEDRLWEYTVSNYWPSKGIAAKTVRAMYNKTLSAERDPPNGHTNGA